MHDIFHARLPVCKTKYSRVVPCVCVWLCVRDLDVWLCVCVCLHHAKYVDSLLLAVNSSERFARCALVFVCTSKSEMKKSRDTHKNIDHVRTHKHIITPNERVGQNKIIIQHDKKPAQWNIRQYCSGVIMGFFVRVLYFYDTIYEYPQTRSRVWGYDTFNICVLNDCVSTEIRIVLVDRRRRWINWPAANAYASVLFYRCTVLVVVERHRRDRTAKGGACDPRAER